MKLQVLPEKLFPCIGRPAKYAGWEERVERNVGIGGCNVALIFEGVEVCELVDMGASTKYWWFFSLKKMVCVDTVLGVADVFEDILRAREEIF